MKSISILSLCILVGAPCVYADGFSFLIGTNVVHVAFANPALSEEDETGICAELQKSFAFAESTSDVFLEAIDGSVKLRRMPLDILPKAISNETIGLYRTNFVHACLVSSALSTVFTEKTQLLQCHTNAISLLETMIDTVNSESFTNLTTQAKLDMFWPPNTIQGQPSQETLDELDRVLFSPVRANVIYMPSRFGIASGFEITDENVSCSLYAFCVAKDRQTGRIKTYPVGYVEGKWRLFFGL